MGKHMQYPKSILQPMGNQDFDPAAYAASETGRNFVDQARFLLAVSYTHLTLPTIRLV